MSWNCSTISFFSKHSTTSMHNKQQQQKINNNIIVCNIYKNYFLSRTHIRNFVLFFLLWFFMKKAVSFLIILISKQRFPVHFFILQKYWNCLHNHQTDITCESLLDLVFVFSMSCEKAFFLMEWITCQEEKKLFCYST